MNKLLITGIVLTCCFISTASDTAVLDSTTSTGYFASAMGLTTEENVLTTGTHSTVAVFVTGNPECQHEKLKALGDKCWGDISKHEFCPTEYRQRAYKCRECKKKIVIQQAILMEEVEPPKIKVSKDVTVPAGSDLIVTY